MIQGIGSNGTETIYRRVLFACVFSYVFIIIVAVLNLMGIIFLRLAPVTIIISGIFI